MSSVSLKMEDSLKELIQILLKNRGEVELGHAILQLSRANRKVVSDFGAQEFVNKFPILFQTRRTKSKVMLRLDVPLEFCPQAGKKGGCTDMRCFRLHFCPFFVKETCKFGDKCKRSHDYQDEHAMRILQHFRLSFLDLSLLQGILKMIVDESEIQRAAAGRSLPDICIFYNNKSGCKKEENCPCLHVCEHFVDGNCKFGGGCKRDHDFSDSHNRKVLQQYDMGHISIHKVLQLLKGRERKRTVNASADGSICSHAVNPSQDDKGKDTEICGFHLRGKCNYGNNCVHHHTDLPYLWQFAAQGDDQWESFSNEENTILENCYCDVENEHSSRVTIKGSLYLVNFQDMTAVPVSFPVCKTTETVIKVRRLSTMSSAVAAAGHVFSTRWEWYWKDENNKWQSYDTPGDGHAVNTTSSQCFEREYQAGKGTHPFSTSHHQYTLDFKRWCQKNDKYKTERPVRRRPAEFVSKHNIADIVSQRRKAVSMARPSTSAEADRVPSHWSSIPDGKDYSCERLSTITEEYKKTEKRFNDSMEKSHKIVSIERVQNLELWIQYAQKKGRMAKKSGKEPEERQLFHGTKPDTVKAICQQGIDWRMCGKHGTAYGEGSYFASSAKYSHRYSNHGVSCGNKQMFLAKVLVGSFTTGNKSFKRPPPKDSSNPHVLYDSCCDNTANPALFVVFENGQSYPEFLITYT